MTNSLYQLYNEKGNLEIRAGKPKEHTQWLYKAISGFSVWVIILG